ncbi:MAG: PSD1 and planctomycete cytochrome C domain-containing protein [Pirellulales bacterium]
MMSTRHNLLPLSRMFLMALLAAVAVSRAAAAELPPAADRKIDFVADVQPLFSRLCHDCHGPDQQESGLRLDVRSAAMRGGLSGAVIVPGRAAESRLLQVVAGLEEDLAMPPEGDPFTAEQIGILRAWIEQGAAWPDEAAGSEPENPAWWAFRAPQPPEIPHTANTNWPLGDLDRFVLARLESAGLSPSPAADRRTIIRRLSFDLCGLPPTPEETAAFVADERSDAYEQLVERLLAAPAYGERWGRHWLDVVRFAESHGFEMNQPRPNAWPFRDWVIRALNDDLPYNEFITAQLAGDALDKPDNDAATAFLVAGAWDQVKSPDPVLTAQQRADELHDMTSTTSGVFLGLTVGCARCHNHKFDPISQQDYYALQAVLAGVEHGERPLRQADSVDRRQRLAQTEQRLAAISRELERFEPLARPGQKVAGDPAAQTALRGPVRPKLNVERINPLRAKAVRFTVMETAGGAEPCIDELEVFAAANVSDDAANVALASLGAKATASGTLPGHDIHQLEHLNDGQYGNGRSWISNVAGSGWVTIELAEPAVIERILWGRDRQGKFLDRLPTRYTIEVADEAGNWRLAADSTDRMPYEAGRPDDPAWRLAGLSAEDSANAQRLLDESASLEQQRKLLASGPMVYAGRFVQPAPTHRLHRGDPMQRREVVAPGAIAALGGSWQLAEGASEQDRRLALARWIASDSNPLTARVMVNRVWHYHFGQGLVSTPSDLGANGGSPTHPELLDWLALRFMAGGWSIKELHRQVVLSATYRQSSAPRADCLAVDAGTRLWWRYPPRRLEAEPIRDAALQISGNLNPLAGGPGYEVFEPNTNYVHVYNPKEEFGPAEWRRMVYQNKPRMEQDEIFGAFDCPDAGQPTPRRNSSTTPLQALNLLNSQFMLQQAELFAARLTAEDPGESVEPRIRRAFQLAFQREPDADELAASADLIGTHGLPVFCRALLNANEFVYVD